MCVRACTRMPRGLTVLRHWWRLSTQPRQAGLQTALSAKQPRKRYFRGLRLSTGPSVVMGQFFLAKTVPLICWGFCADLAGGGACWILPGSSRSRGKVCWMSVACHNIVSMLHFAFSDETPHDSYPAPAPSYTRRKRHPTTSLWHNTEHFSSVQNHGEKDNYTRGSAPLRDCGDVAVRTSSAVQSRITTHTHMHAHKHTHARAHRHAPRPHPPLNRNPPSRPEELQAFVGPDNPNCNIDPRTPTGGQACP